MKDLHSMLMEMYDRGVSDIERINFKYGSVLLLFIAGVYSYLGSLFF